jgi:dihydrofolate reductase
MVYPISVLGQAEGAMGNVIWHVSMSLDGFIAGPGDAMDWAFEYAEPSAVADEVIRTTGAVIAGRHSYDVGERDEQEVYGGAWTGPQFVLTHNPPDDAAKNTTITFLSGDVRSSVVTALAAAGGKNVVVIGANLARQCIEEGLIDEIIVHLVPVLLGDGVRFFERPGAEKVTLERMSVAESAQVTDLRFRVVTERRPELSASS